MKVFDRNQIKVLFWLPWTYLGPPQDMGKDARVNPSWIFRDALLDQDVTEVWVGMSFLEIASTQVCLCCSWWPVVDASKKVQNESDRVRQ